MNTRCRRTFWFLLLGIFCGCNPSLDLGKGQPRRGTNDSVEMERSRSALTAVACKTNDIKVVDMHSDFRDIWAGRETPETGKQADPNVSVLIDFGATIEPARVTAQFAPAVTDGSCGATVAATNGRAMIPSSVWGTVTSDSTRPSAPAPYNVLARKTISGVVSAGGPLAAGGDITLSSFSANSGSSQPVGLIAGGQVTLVNGSVNGNVTYGTTSTFPQTVWVSGTKTQAAFDVEASFQDLTVLSVLLNEAPADGSATSSYGNLQLTGTETGLNVFKISADTLSQASSVQITVPVGAGALINVSGAAVAIQNKGLSLQGATAASVLWNFPEAGLVQISSVGLQGSILAPNAWLSFDSASLNGTVVVRDFASAGSGSLQSAPLNVSLMLGSVLPSAVALQPTQALVPGCTYTFTLPSSPALTTDGKCLNNPLSVTFKVASANTTTEMRELSGVHSDPVLRTVRAFRSRSGINTPLSDVWSRYADVIGTRTLVASGAARPDTTLSGQMLTYYQQYHQGYPIAEYGYLVASEGGVFRSARGQIAPSLPTSLPTPISDSAAVQAVLQYLNLSAAPWTVNPTKYHAPVMTLALVAQQISPSNPNDFTLQWIIDLTGTGVDMVGIELDATTGNVVGFDRGKVRLSDPTLIDPKATYSQQATNGVNPINHTEAQTIDVAQYIYPDNTYRTTLSTGGPNDPSRLSTMFYVLPTKDAELDPALVVDPTPDTYWTTTEPISQAMATAQWGLVRANNYLVSLGFNLGKPQTAWTNVDGVGAQRVEIRWADPLTPGDPDAYYQSSKATEKVAPIVLVNGKKDPNGNPNWPEKTLDIVPHEFGHLFLQNVRRSVGLKRIAYKRESGSIDEALADLFAVASVHSTFAGINGWDCVACGFPGSRLVSDPFFLGLPNYYKQPPYKTYLPSTVCGDGENGAPANDMCSVHDNSTVISHWGYLVAVGAPAATPANPCGIKVDPLDAKDIDKSFRLLVNLSYGAAGTMVGNPPTDEPSFAQFRDATRDVAQNLIKTGTAADTLRKVELAWYRVGLGPDYLSAANDMVRVTPADDATSVYPWYTFSWRQDVDGLGPATEWDLQIDDDPAFSSPVKWENPAPITDHVTKDGVTFYTVTLALPEAATTRYYWRVRPHTTDPWIPAAGGAACYPVHSFLGTTKVDDVQNVRIRRTTADGKAPVAATDFEWDLVKGFSSYNVYIGTQDPNCKAGTGTLFYQGVGADWTYGRVPSPDDPIQHIFTSRELQPEENYFINVEAVGPKGFDGKPTTHGCAKLEFQTSSLTTPGLRSVNGGFYMSYNDRFYTDYHGAPVQFEMENCAKLDHYRFEEYEMDATGNCILPAIRKTIVPQVQDGILGCHTVGPVIPTLSRSGLCLTATAVAANGKESPAIPLAEMKRFFYLHDIIPKISPGNSNDPPSAPPAPVLVGNLPNDSFGKDLEFRWTADPDALGYVVKVARKRAFDPSLVTPDPPNCARGNMGHPKCLPSDQHCGSWCTGIPSSAHQSVKGANSVILPGKDVAKGRYCWTVWPELPGTPGKQPDVSVMPFYCYTSAPAKPEIVVDNPPAQDAYSSAVIKGHVTFAYVPDGQFEVKITPSGKVLKNDVKCPVYAPELVYKDRYDCQVDFEITPQEATTYTITANVWNSDKYPAVKDASTLVTPAVTKSFSTVGCGSTGQACCDGKCDGGNACVAKKCTACGGSGQMCCNATTGGIAIACNTGLTCLSGTCGLTPADPTITDITLVAGYGAQVPTPQLFYANATSAKVRVQNKGGQLAGGVQLPGKLSFYCGSNPIQQFCDVWGVPSPGFNVGSSPTWKSSSCSATADEVIYSPSIPGGGYVDYAMEIWQLCDYGTYTMTLYKGTAVSAIISYNCTGVMCSITQMNHY